MKKSLILIVCILSSIIAFGHHGFRGGPCHGGYRGYHHAPIHHYHHGYHHNYHHYHHHGYGWPAVVGGIVGGAIAGSLYAQPYVQPVVAPTSVVVQQPIAVAQPVVVPANNCGPGEVRQVYVRARYQTTVDAYGNRVRTYVPAHYETRVGW